MKKATTGRASDQFTLRFPDGLRNKVKKIAARNRRTMNAELLILIEAGINAPAVAATLPAGPAAS